MATDAITGKILTGPYGSLYLSKSGDRAAFDLYGGLDVVPNTQWDIYVADQSSITQITNDDMRITIRNCRPMAAEWYSSRLDPAMWACRM